MTPPATARRADLSTPMPTGWPQLATDLCLLDVLGVERMAAGAWSMGCATLLHAVVRAPQRVDRLVLAHPPDGRGRRLADPGGAIAVPR